MKSNYIIAILAIAFLLPLHTAVGQTRNNDRNEPTYGQHYRHLKPLAWMIGDWIDQDETGTVRTNCKWSENRNFIIRTFSASVGNDIQMRGTQVIGWNPATRKIHSWVFDNSGGLAESDWKRQGKGWALYTSAILPNGKKASEVRVFTPIDDNSFSWQAVSRTVDGNILPNIDPVTIVRVK